MRTLFAVLLSAATIPSALADEPAAPPAPAAPGQLAAGKLNLAVNLEVNMSADLVAKPLSIAPDVAYGVTPELTVMLVHSRYGITGFRATAGGGLCLTGTDGGCPKVYDNVGAEAWYDVARGPTAVSVGGGFHAISFDRGFYDLKVGAKLRHTHGTISIITLPSVLVAATKRSDMVKNKDSLWIPVVGMYKATPELSVGLGTGIKAQDLSAFGDSWEVSLGALATYAIDPATTVGGSWIFGKVLAGVDNPPSPAPAVKGLDFRGLQVWGARTF